MTPVSDADKRYLLQLARNVILDQLGKSPSAALPERSSPVFSEKRGCFVTLEAKGRLRGCIGTLEPVQPLIASVKENAVHAGFHDPRFAPVTLREMQEITIEISILTSPSTLCFQNADALKKQIIPGVHGVILSKGRHRATFLPQVWHQLPETESFLGQLCLKAGMERTCWKDAKTTVEVYEVSAFSEKDMIRKTGAK